MNKVTPNIFIGDMNAARDIQFLRKEKITHIVNAAQEVLNQFGFDEFVYLNLPILDYPNSNIEDYFTIFNIFVKFATRNGGKVLVHCAAGISRSATLVCAYLIWEFGLNPKKALEYLRRCRPQVNPNDGFLHKLTVYYNNLQHHR